jgi:hypothetical protein
LSELLSEFADRAACDFQDSAHVLLQQQGSWPLPFIADGNAEVFSVIRVQVSFVHETARQMTDIRHPVRSQSLNEMVGELFLTREMPEPPKESFFRGLFGGGSRPLDREELCESKTVQLQIAINFFWETSFKMVSF